MLIPTSNINVFVVWTPGLLVGQNTPQHTASTIHTDSQVRKQILQKIQNFVRLVLENHAKSYMLTLLNEAQVELDLLRAERRKGQEVWLAMYPKESIWICKDVRESPRRPMKPSWVFLVFFMVMCINRASNEMWCMLKYSFVGGFYQNLQLLISLNLMETFLRCSTFTMKFCSLF